MFDVPRRASQPSILGWTVHTLASLTGPERLTVAAVRGGGDLVGRDVSTVLDGSDVGQLLVRLDAPGTDPTAVLAAWLSHPWSHDSFDDAKHSYLPSEHRHGPYRRRLVTSERFRQITHEGLVDLDDRLRATFPSARSAPSARRWSHRISEGHCVVWELVVDGLEPHDAEADRNEVPAFAEVLAYDRRLEALTVLIWTRTGDRRGDT